MAPTSRIFLTRHAQAQHNVDLDYMGNPDSPLTALGKKQAASMAHQIPKLQQEAELIVSSPLKRTLQTTRLGWGPAVERLGGIKKVVTLPQAQEVNDYPCDTGSSKEVLEADPEFAQFDFSSLTPDWTSKRGFWADDAETVRKRAQWVRQWLRERPEANIVLVAHGDILRRITGNEKGPSTYMWKNAEVREFRFRPDTVDKEEAYIYQEEEIAAAGGYAPSSTEADIIQAGHEQRL
ncbi:hypothetical protein DOTSEDRAFT_137925 [Dothistroma septosporum NZE10]|uniref:Phosphoglycerate mutase-like protein n=1 Tax=Dothistroma septosporum (strain NZE10 / CBS 128990) TaxID=675120 RepID=N1PCU5_DOTSN|nr:hypothetical protein DOTSEDRAFT_137925 [Dothistroma septosporum NZE10]